MGITIVYAYVYWGMVTLDADSQLRLGTDKPVVLDLGSLISDQHIQVQIIGRLL